MTKLFSESVQRAGEAKWPGPHPGHPVEAMTVTMPLTCHSPLE